jgi:predicted ArsR family transcriptional regulator
MDTPPTASTNLSLAQGHVLVAVIRRGEASADAVAESLGITPSAVRQHLAALRTGGLVASRQERGRSGRPADLYHSTELGESLFAGPSAVDLSVELLGYIEDENPELVSRIFERRRRRRVEECRDRLAGKALKEKVAGLAEIPSASRIFPVRATGSPSTAVPSGRWPPASVWLVSPSSNSSRRSSQKRRSAG